MAEQRENYKGREIILRSGAEARGVARVSGEQGAIADEPELTIDGKQIFIVRNSYAHQFVHRCKVGRRLLCPKQERREQQCRQEEDTSPSHTHLLKVILSLSESGAKRAGEGGQYRREQPVAVGSPLREATEQ